MKKLTKKIRYKTEEHVATLYAMPRFGAQRWIAFATCHIATLPLIKEKGVSACASLLTLIRSCQLGKAA